MNPAEWERVKQIVADAMELPPAERSKFLDVACNGDAPLRTEVESLLGADQEGYGFLDLDRLPERIGAYRVVREIGRGGMGTVFLGERADGQFEQRVAIKVIKRGMDTDSVLRRFYAERQILARLQHPNITRLLDGGTYEDRPYFLMEYLEGETILEWSRTRKLPLEERVRLFLAVCDAVDYAHRNLVLHRDLKASNILVDAAGTVKLLDFGIARLLDTDRPGETTVAMRPLTPQAASPEQVRGEPLTTASDVYALGLLLFELLAGRPAYEVKSASPLEMARVVCEEEAPRPSSLADGPDARRLRGDLDNIVLRSLEKDSARRYQRAADLGEDLRRWLDGLPVLARPAGRMYRVQKFVSRNRRTVAAAAIVLIAISAAVGDAILEGRRARRRFEDLRQLSGSFLFEFHDAIANLPGATPARELVMQRGLQYLDSLAREASSDVGLKEELAQGYVRIGSAQGINFDSNLGKRDAARASFQKAAALMEDVVRARPKDVDAKALLSRALLGISITLQGRDSAQCMALERRVIEMLEPFPPRIELAQAYQGVSETLLDLKKVDEALAERQKGIGILQKLLASNPENEELLRTMAQAQKRVAYIYLVALHEPAKAGQPLQAAMAIDEKLVRKNPENATARLDLARDRSYVGSMLRARGDWEGARRMFEDAISMRSGVLAVDPRNHMLRIALLTDYQKLAALLAGQRLASEARAAAQHGLALADGFDGDGAADPEARATVEQLKKLAANL